MTTPDQIRLRRAVRYFYDLQKLRVQSSNRSTMKDEVELTEEDQLFMTTTGEGLNKLEKEALKEVKRLLKPIPIFKKWLDDQKGIGPTMAGVLLSEIDIVKAETVSKMWRFCGLATDPATGRAERLTRGKKAPFSPWLKSKVLKVMGDCMIKAGSPYRSYYDNYKHRKENTILKACMGCEGGGQATVPDDDAKPDPTTKKKATKKVKCSNCEGTGGPAPWGNSKAHRHNAAMRYMVKCFLADFYAAWRELEGLPVAEPYAVAVLGRVHGDHGGTNVQMREVQNTQTGN